MKRKILLGTSVGILLNLLVLGSAFAAGNPSGTGQPNAECGSPNATQEPSGFLTNGFANAESHYAGSDGTPSATHAQSGHAVSQYDVACYQVTTNHQ